jgi:hypothetical protein
MVLMVMCPALYGTESFRSAAALRLKDLATDGANPDMGLGKI